MESWPVNEKVSKKVVANSKADVFCCQEVRAWCSLNLPDYHNIGAWENDQVTPEH